MNDPSGMEPATISDAEERQKNKMELVADIMRILMMTSDCFHHFTAFLPKCCPTMHCHAGFNILSNSSFRTFAIPRWSSFPSTLIALLATSIAKLTASFDMSEHFIVMGFVF